VKLAIEGREPDGWYTLGRLKVGGTGPTTPPRQIRLP